MLVKLTSDCVNFIILIVVDLLFQLQKREVVCFPFFYPFVSVYVVVSLS